VFNLVRTINRQLEVVWTQSVIEILKIKNKNCKIPIQKSSIEDKLLQVGYITV
ncbi:unnamed protein product, partial [Callosobruchus maculatus]